MATHTPPRPLPHDDWRSTMPPAEAATDIGLDLDGDGALWYPAPPATVIRPMAIVAALIAAVAAFVFGPDWLSWWMGGGAR